MRYRALPALLLFACGNVTETHSDAPLDDAPLGDAGPIDGPGSQARCDPSKPFGMPSLVLALSSSNDEYAFAMTRDELTGFVGHIVQPPTPSATLLVTHRASITAPWPAADAVQTAAINNTAGDEHAPSSVADGLILYFHRQTTTGIGIVAATRNSTADAFSAGSGVTVDGPGLVNALSPTISADGRTLYWIDYNDFGKMFAATRGTTPNDFVTKRAASSIAIGGSPVLSADELTMYYANGTGDDILMSTRANKSDTFGTGMPVPNVNSTASDIPLALSYDGCVLYLSSERAGGVGGKDLWEAHRPL